MLRLVKNVIIKSFIGFSLVYFSIIVFKGFEIHYKLPIMGVIDYSLETELRFTVYNLVLRTIADENDLVTFIIDSPGGDAKKAMDLVHNIEMTDAHTNSVVVRQAASAAALIAVSTDSLNVFETAQFMFHRPYIPGANGEMIRYPELMGRAINMTDYIAISYAFKFLSPDQQVAYLNNADVELSGRQMAINYKMNKLLGDINE